MATVTEPRATLEDLYRTEGKAELIKGRIVALMASGDAPSDAAFNIAISLRLHSTKVGKGVAKANGTDYAVSELASGRESFQPSASYCTGPRPANRMRFIQGAPDFAAEVGSEFDYGPAAEAELEAKRQDYFAAGTQVVWDVDPRAKVVHVYRSSDQTTPITYRLGEAAEAEPAVPGWRMTVDEIFIS